MSEEKILSPFPYFGSKSAAAPLIWSALGNPDNFVDPFSGSNSLLWLRPKPGKIETVNDAWGAIPNFLRAVRAVPEAVADAALWNVDETMMHARHRWLVERMDSSFVERLMTDPEFCDAEVAGWWVWGQSIWIGSGWCADTPYRKIPELASARGILRGRLPHLIGPHNARKVGGQIPSLSGSDGSGVGYGRGIFASGRREDLIGYFEMLSARLQKVRITCGDWARVVTPAVTVSHGLTGVVLDPPYKETRTANLYAVDSLTVADDVRRWAIANGDNVLLRIVLCGYEGEHDMPMTWRKIAWKTNGGYGNQDRENANAARERLWLSPHCLMTKDELPPAQGSLFDKFIPQETTNDP